MAIRVVVAEMDDAQREETARQIRREPEILLAGTAKNGLQALEMVQSLKPDVLICGMVMQGLDGCGLLERLQAVPAHARPATLVLSAVTRGDFIRRAFEWGAGDYLVKPCETETLLRRVRELARQRMAQAHPQVDQRLSGMLLGLGIPAHVKGYRFLQEAVRATMAEPGLMAHLMHDLYPRVAMKYQTTPGCVERSIRHAITMAWERGRPEESSRILGRSVNTAYERPTSGELIALVAERMKLNM